MSGLRWDLATPPRRNLSAVSAEEQQTLRRAAERLSGLSRCEPDLGSGDVRRGGCESTPWRGAEAYERRGGLSPVRRRERVRNTGKPMNGMPGASKPTRRYTRSSSSERHRNPMRVTASPGLAPRRGGGGGARKCAWSASSFAHALEGNVRRWRSRPPNTPGGLSEPATDTRTEAFGTSRARR